MNKKQRWALAGQAKRSETGAFLSRAALAFCYCNYLTSVLMADGAKAQANALDLADGSSWAQKGILQRTMHLDPAESRIHQRNLYLDPADGSSKSSACDLTLYLDPADGSCWV
jgi:hypothetical protein